MAVIGTSAPGEHGETGAPLLDRSERIPVAQICRVAPFCVGRLSPAKGRSGSQIISRVEVKDAAFNSQHVFLIRSPHGSLGSQSRNILTTA